MQFYPIKLTAGVEFHQRTAGRIFLIDNLIGSQSVDVTLLDSSGSPRQIMPGRKVLFKCVTEFSGVILKADVDCTVWIFISYDDVSNGYADGGNVSIPGGVMVTNDNAHPVPISFPGGVVNMTAANVGINNDDAHPVPVKLHATDINPLQVQQVKPATITGVSINATAVIAALLAADATRCGFYARNAGPDPVALVQVGGTFADAAVVLQAGETWKEDIAPGAAWYCICDAGKAATVKVLGAA